MSCFSISYARPLIIVGIPEAPLKFYNKDKKPVGIDVEIIQYIFSRLNVEYKIKLFKSTLRVEKFWKTGMADMVFTFSYKDSRAKYLYYAKQSHISIKWNFFIRKKNKNKISYNTFKDFKGLRVGVITGVSYTKEFWNVAQSGVFTLDETCVAENQIQKLIHKRIDVVPMNTLTTLYKAKMTGSLDKIIYLKKPLKTKPYYNVFSKASDYSGLKELIKKYDNELQKMKKNGSLDKILQKYGVKELY